MTDLTPYKIAIFEGINDLPTAPTANSGQNISYNNAKHNDLIDVLQGTIDDLISRVTSIENSSSSTNNSTLPESSNSELFSFSIEGPSSLTYLGEATGGTLAYYCIENASIDFNLYLDSGFEGPGYGVSKKIEQDNGIYYIPDSDSYTIPNLDNLYLHYDNVTGELSSSVRIFYQ